MLCILYIFALIVSLIVSAVGITGLFFLPREQRDTIFFGCLTLVGLVMLIGGILGFIDAFDIGYP